MTSALSRSPLLTRVLSGVLAGVAVFSLGYFGGRFGLYLVCSIAIVLGIREYARMTFQRWRMPKEINLLYGFISLLFYVAMIDFFELGLLWFALSNLIFFTGCLWITRGRVQNDDLLPALALGSFGILYCVLFPHFAVQIVRLPDGDLWFWFMLLVVFFGDTFAYFGGRFFGRSKLMPQISPNKTWAGAVAGLLGSCAAGGIYALLVFPNVFSFHLPLFCVVCGFAAQSGDLLMSLVKRVANIKDTGRIMPGHGGILDRLDGIFIACPLVYAYALYVMKSLAQ